VVTQELDSRTVGIAVPSELPILPSGENVVYPSTVVPLKTADDKVIRLIDDVMSEQKVIGLFTVRDRDTPLPDGLARVGTAVLVARMLKWPDGSVQVLLQGLNRIRLKGVTQIAPYLRGVVETFEDSGDRSPELDALTRNLLTVFQKVVMLAPNLPKEVGVAVVNIPEPSNLADFIAAHTNLSREEGQDILETVDVVDRIRKLTGYVNRELELLELGSKLQTQIKGQMDKAQREFYLREQMKAIQKELGEGDDHATEMNDLREKMEEACLPPEAKKQAERELDRLSKMNPAAAEYTMSRTYFDWLVEVPWAKHTDDNLDIVEGARILDEDHYDLVKVKDRILDYLAVRRLKDDMKGPILCFVGPPGTGKTSMGQSIARAMGRKFVRVSLGGVRDEADIRGHRRTYIGALPGRIIQGIRQAGSNNPVFMLDEIDKMGTDFRGDPSAALLEVLDPEQNCAFVDHYLDVPYDLTKVMFITTANMLDTVPPALRDRMEVIELLGYSEQEKLHIARTYLVPRQERENGLESDMLELPDETILTMIRDYTREAGVRNLEREIGTVCRKVARGIAQGNADPVTATSESLRDYLGQQRFRYELAGETDEIGVATGLAWTPAGGDVLFVEASLLEGKGNLILTGKLGDVMQESARAALSYARSRAESLGIDSHFYEKKDVHIHVPAGAIPKDGPSAGVTMTTALISALTECPISKDVGMTGEITLVGKVLPVGGVKEKVLAAHRAGVTKVILPEENEKDLEDIPQEVKEKLKFVFVKHVDDVLCEVIHMETLKRSPKRRKPSQLGKPSIAVTDTPHIGHSHVTPRSRTS